MIEEISISGLGIIAEAHLRPGPGLTVVTGETGAGKTMVLSAVAMLLGAKPVNGLVTGERARVEGRLTDVPTDVADAVDLAGGQIEDAELILARVVPRDGRARAFAGGAAVPAATLAQIGAELITVHGQADQFRLRSPARQRALLDAYGRDELGRALSDYRSTYRSLVAVTNELNERTNEARARAAEADYLRFGTEEIAALDPQPGEDEALRAEEERLANVGELTQACSGAHAALLDESGEQDAVSAVSRAARQLERAARHDPALTPIADRLNEVVVILGDAAAELAAHAGSLESDPGRLAAVQERRAALGRLTRKYGESVDDVLVWARTQSARLADLEQDTDRIEELQRERHGLRLQLADQARRLSALRIAAASDLSAAVTAELAGLAMAGATFSVAVNQEPAEKGLDLGAGPVAFGADGADQVSFLLAPHSGAAPAPLGQGASGGELSRVMLALEVAAAGADGIATMIFDEVDAGVGGKAAVEVGRRLARLAQYAQVIVVTHLPQVAAFGETHLVVAKNDDGSVTATTVRPVEGQARRRELARMLAGQDGSAHALAHADELLEIGTAHTA